MSDGGSDGTLSWKFWPKAARMAQKKRTLLSERQGLRNAILCGDYFASICKPFSKIAKMNFFDSRPTLL